MSQHLNVHEKINAYIETRNVSMGHGCPRYCQIRINRELSLTKGNNSLKHGDISTIIKLEENIIVLNNMTKFHRILIKTI